MDISSFFDTFHDVEPDMVMGAYVTGPARSDTTLYGKDIVSDESRHFVLVLMGGYQYMSKVYTGPREAEYAAAMCLKKIRGEEEDDAK